MRKITKQTEPRQLTKFRNAGGTWNTFSLDDGKREVKKQLLAEQHSLCAYCTTSISFCTMKIEHWCPRTYCRDRHLDYANLLAVCKGCYNTGKFLHCDTSKADQLIELSPLNVNHINVLSYSKATGKLLSTNAKHQVEIDRVLNLNIAPLRKIRKQLLATFKLGLRKKYKNRRANFQKELSVWRQKNGPFDSIVIQYLEKRLLQ
ncbi:MAG: retron system putative HNH endonuclease [Bacteroidota bacterium]